MIPILINNRDLLNPVKNLVEYFLDVPEAEIVLADNASTYPPLLDWYKSCPVEVHHLGGNFGPRAAQRLITHRTDVKYFFMCDPDLDFTGVPKDFLQVFVEALEMNAEIHGVGVSLRMDDLPDTPSAISAKRIEPPATIRDEYWFSQGCDTAGVLRRFTWGGSYAGLRSAKHVVRHLPWYHSDSNRPPDFQWFLDNCDPQGTVYTAAYKYKCT